MKILMIVFVLCFCTTFAEASKPKYYTYNQPVKTYSYSTIVTGNNDQERCQAEADYMAANNITGHVWGVIGSFEGVGYGSSPNCNTCVPSSISC